LTLVRLPQDYINIPLLMIAPATHCTDRGQEFFAYKFQEKLLEYGIKFRPIRPRFPHLNGKVERSQRTDWEEFYSIVDLKSPELKAKLQVWEDYYNHERPHSSLGNKTPWEKWQELASQTPIHDEVEALFDPKKEKVKLQKWKSAQELKEVEKR